MEEERERQNKEKERKRERDRIRRRRERQGEYFFYRDWKKVKWRDDKKREGRDQDSVWTRER